MFIITDMEGVAGVANFDDWCTGDSRYYDVGRRLLTDEVNAAICGFATHGFDDILVCDGHGHGAIDIERLDHRVRLSRGWAMQCGPYTHWPFGLDSSFDALAFVGQHAKASTTFSHMTHTGNFYTRDISINELSVGEYGQLVLCAGELDIPVIFTAGEKALCAEAEALTPHVVTAAVLEGSIPGDGEDLNYEQYGHFHEGAIHLQPATACNLIERRAATAAERFASCPSDFQPLRFDPPYREVCRMRPGSGRPARTVEYKHPHSIIALINETKQKVESLMV